MLDNKTIYERARYYTVELYDEIEAGQQSYFAENFEESELLNRIMQKFTDEIEYLETLIEIEEQGA